MQKNPGTVRVAEEDKGWRQTTATAWAGRAAKLLSPAAARHCAAARDNVFLRAADLARWAPRPGKPHSARRTMSLQYRYYRAVCKLANDSDSIFIIVS